MKASRTLLKENSKKLESKNGWIKLLSIFLFAFLLPLILSSITAYAADVTLSWTPNTEADLNRYELYQSEIMGDKSGDFELKATIIPPTSQITIQVDDTKNWRWQLYAIDNSGNRSFGSNTVDLYDQIPPGAVKGLDKQ